MKQLWRALNFFRPDAGRIGGVGVLLVLAIGANLLKPWPLAIIVDSILGDRPVPDLLRRWSGSPETLLALLTIAILGLHMAHGGLSAWQNYLSIKVGLCGLRRVRDALFTHLQRLSLRYFQTTRNGDLLYRATWDTLAFQTLFQQGLVTFLTAALSLVLMVAIMWRLNERLTLVALAVVPVLLVSIQQFGKRMRRRGAVAQQADSQVTSLVQQALAAMPLIQSYTREEEERRTFTAQTVTAQERRLTQHGWELLYWLGVAVVFAAGTALLVWTGSRQVLDGHLSLGGLLVFLAYLSQLYEPLNQLSHVGATVANATVGTQRVFEVLDARDEVREQPHARLAINARVGDAGTPRGALRVQGAIEFDSVSFAYTAGAPVLREVSFQVEAGQTVAIIGPSGAGKSTLLHLLPRFFDPSAGAVRLDGVDIRELRVKALRSQVSLVLQEPLLLPATVAENIAFGRPDATRAAIEAGARGANAAAFIEKLPQGYDTVIGEGAAHLSVGERQRLNLARAFLKDAPVLLLDEPTSALDSESEALVLASLVELTRGRTVLMVAHRLSTIRQADRVLVLEGGRVTQCGPPAALIQAPGYYARLLAGQAALE